MGTTGNDKLNAIYSLYEVLIVAVGELRIAKAANNNSRSR